MVNKYYQILNDRRALWSSIVGQKKGEEVFGYWYEDYFFEDGTWTAPEGTIEGSVRVHGIGGGVSGAPGTPEAPGQGGHGGHYTWMNLPNGTYSFTYPGTGAGSDPVVIGSIFRASGGDQDVSTCIPAGNAISGGAGDPGSGTTGGTGGGGGSPLGIGIFPGGMVNNTSARFGGGGRGQGSSVAGGGVRGLIWFEYKKQSPELPKLPKFIGLASSGTAAIGGVIWSIRPDVNNLNCKQERILSPQASNWQSVVYGDGMFVAVANSGTKRVMTSPDGITWTSRTPPSGGTWLSVAYGDGMFVAVSNSGTNRVMTSPDGITWTSRTPPSGSSSNWTSVTYGNGRFVAIGNDQTMISTNGITWTYSDMPGANNWSSVAYGNGIFIAVASSGSNNTRVHRSTDGLVWTNSFASVTAWQRVVYGNGIFIAVAGTGIMMRGNGYSWTSVTVPNYAWRNLAYGDGVWVATTSDSMGARSASNYRTYRTMISNDNGLTWHLTDALMGANALCYVPEE